MKIIYEVTHACGWGPIGEGSLFEKRSAAIAHFETKRKELRGKDNYIRGSWSESKRDGMIRHASFQTEAETNNENGHEFWEESEYLTIMERELIDAV